MDSLVILYRLLSIVQILYNFSAIKLSRIVNMFDFLFIPLSSIPCYQEPTTKSTSAELDANAKPEQNWKPANMGPDNGRLQNQLSMAGGAWKPSMQCKSRVTKNTQPVIVVTKCQQPNQLQLSFIDVNAKPKQNWMPALWFQTLAVLLNQLSMAGRAWKPSMQRKRKYMRQKKFDVTGRCVGYAKIC